MERTRLLFFVAVAFFAGLLLAAAVMSGGGLVGGEADALLVQVDNTGHPARVTLLVYPVGANPGAGRWEWTLPSGGSQTARYPEPDGLQTVQLFVVWTDAVGDHDGEARLVADPGECPGRAGRMLVQLDTSRGVTIRGSPDLRCE